MEKGKDNGFILHSRRFRENSRILDLFTYHQGRMSVLARVPRKQAMKKTLLFQSFTELFFHWRGSGSLPNLGTLEEVQMYPMKGDKALYGLYCNELILYSMTNSIAAPELFVFYRKTVKRLSEEVFSQSILREFENKILEESGHGLDFFYDCNTGEKLRENNVYYFQPGYGFSAKEPTGKRLQLTMDDMYALQAGELDSQENSIAIRRVYRTAISHMLHNRSLHSRQLFREIHQLK